MIKRNLGSLLIVLLFLSFLPTSGRSDPQSLFYAPYQPLQRTMPAAHPLRVVRQAIVAVNLEALQAGHPSQVRLNLFDDTVLNGVHSRTEQKNAHAYTWYGQVQGIPSSTIILVVDRERLAGVVRMPQVTYKIQPLEGKFHVVRHIHTEAASTAINEAAIPVANASPVSAEHDVFRLTNAERAEAGLPALAWDDALFSAARGHSLDMATNNYFAHDGQDGRDPSDRMADAGYDWIPLSENIAYGYPSPEAVVAGWMVSTGHRNNILSTSACELGVGLATHANTQNRPYWTQNFGRFSRQEACPAITGNQMPVAQFTAAPLAGEAPHIVIFDGSGSYDPDGQITGYQWDFGDGTSGSEAVMEHSYAVEGSYTVRLTVVDNADGLSSYTEADYITVGEGVGEGAVGTGIGSSDGGGSSGCYIQAAHQ